MIEQDKNEFLYDVRLVERHIARGKINKKDYEAYLRTLNNVENDAETISPSALFDLPEETENAEQETTDEQ